MRKHSQKLGDVSRCPKLRWGSNLSLTSPPHSQSQPWDPPGCPLRLWQPNLPIWAAFLFVFLRSLSPKLLSLLLQWISPFSSKEHKELWPERLQAATLTRYLMAMKYLLALVVSEDLRLQTAQVLIWKRQKLLSEDKIPQSKWGGEETILRCSGWRKVQP